MKRQELQTKFVFDESVIVEIRNDHDSIMVEILDVGDPEDGGRVVILTPDEVDLLISALATHKHKVLNPRKAVEE
jgi:hypothetical protein